MSKFPKKNVILLFCLLLFAMISFFFSIQIYANESNRLIDKNYETSLINPKFDQYLFHTGALQNNNTPLFNENTFKSIMNEPKFIMSNKQNQLLYKDSITKLADLKIRTNEVIFEIELLTRTPIYEKQSIQSAEKGVVSPQKVRVIRQEGNYFLIPTWLGNYWIYPDQYIDENGKTKLRLDKKYPLYTTNNLQAKTNYVVSPQVVTVLDETDEWWKIYTWLGDMYLYKNEYAVTGQTVRSGSGGNKNSKVAYLTFDDGPNQYTDDILEILAKYKAKATFFMLEPNMRRHQNLVKQLVEEGHYPALHSVTHDRNKLYVGSPYNPVWEMETSRETLKSIIGEDIYLVRMPYGSVPYMNPLTVDALAEYNYKMWDWTIDSNDWRYDSSSYKNIITNVEEQLAKVEKSGEPVVILLHDRAQTVKALPAIIELLLAKGYHLQEYNPNEHVVVNFWNDHRL